MKERKTQNFVRNHNQNTSLSSYIFVSILPKRCHL